jgi:hypothetical protein
MMHALAFVVPPAAPSNLVATATGFGSNRRVVLTWTQNSLNATGFTVQRANNVSFTTGLVTVPLGKVTTYTDPIGITSQTFYYRVFASNTVGDAATPGFPTMSSDSPFSNTVTVGTPPVTRPPAAPSILRVTALTRTSVALAWRDNSNNEDGFLIQRTTLSPFGQAPRTFTVGANVTAFTDTTVAPNSLYYYRVRAFNAAGNSVLSNLVLVRTPR